MIVEVVVRVTLDVTEVCSIRCTFRLMSEVANSRLLLTKHLSAPYASHIYRGAADTQPHIVVCGAGLLVNWRKCWDAPEPKSSVLL
jgi:hypothetical protein